ncbi:hypothetical protein F5Y14DRAFT_422232 [Nemania sp. NC0429]|nr:hypothetical protein F5Y14DRAFT_422232 [Nemania sp. NC0429]
MDTSSRRKACDLCYRKKIRCDGLKPTCSNCSLYKVSCETTVTRKKFDSSSGGQPTVGIPEANSTETRKDDRLDARLARIEAKLDALQSAESTVYLDRPSHEGNATDERALGIPVGSETAYIPSPANWASTRSRLVPPVPPLTEALTIIDVYFQNYNPLFPLFSQQSFMRMMNDYYRPCGERKRIHAGVINVVLALGYRIEYCQHGDTQLGFNGQKMKTCIDNAQVMLDEFMTRDQDTLGLQALLGLVMLYQTYPDQTASSVLISAAMRLAHSLRLESRTILSEISPQEARHRANIFWICYTLDKDTSLRTITPSLQIDNDIEIDLPGSAGDDWENILYSTDRQSQFHLFRAKVQLAHVEGRIYDTLFSNRSRKLSPEARQKAVLQVDGLIERWERSIPGPFQLENMSRNLVGGPLVHMTVLYQTYMMCLTMRHGLYTQASPWLKALGGLGSDLLRTFSPCGGDGGMDSGGGGSSTPTIWGKCVKTSRDILKILSYQPFGGCSVWLSACAYFSAMTFLFVNLIYDPRSPSAEEDRRLAELSMLQLQKYFDYKGLEKFKQLRHVLVQIEGTAKAVLKDVRLSSSSSRPPTTTAGAPPPPPPLPQPAAAPSQPRPTFESTFLPSALPLSPPPVDVFDVSFGQDSQASEVATTTAELGWMGAPGSSALFADPVPHAWATSGTAPFFAFGPD